MDKPIKSSETNYVIPAGGNYLVSTEIITGIPTGKYETIINPNKKWWQFWLPKYIKSEIFEYKWIYAGKEHRYLLTGEVVDYPVLYRL